jgi:AcrR family transcriptional regulator
MEAGRGRQGRGPFVDYRLPRGRHGLSPEFVAENQRWRLLGAAAEALAELGYAKTTTREVASRAGVSSNTFYKYFDGLSDCVCATHETAAECVWGVVSGACSPQLDPSERLRVAIEAALAFAGSEPALAQLLGAEPLAANAEIAAERERLIGRLATLLRQGSPPPASTRQLPAGSEERLVAGAVAFVVDRVKAGRLAGVGPQLTQLLLAPGMAERA